MGIKAKIRFGFIAIGILLFLSGIISSLELFRFNRATHSLLEKNQNSVLFSKQMLDAVQEQNTTLLLSITDTLGNALYDSLLLKSSQGFDRAFQSAQSIVRDPEQFEAIRTSASYYYSIVSQVDGHTDIAWFTQVYKTPYYNLTQAIKLFMVDIQERTIEYTVQLERNAYRASMVGIIALGSGILLLLVFHFLIATYFISPVLKITQSLKGYNLSRIPFLVNVHTRDEISSLRDEVNSLIETNKRAKPQ